MTNPFDSHAREYDEWFDTHALEYNAELEAIRTLLPDKGEGIEIGVGTGRFAGPLTISTGIEPSEAMRRLAQGRGINIIAGTAESLPVTDKTYDYALLVTTVCFLASLQSAFTEVYRILREGGFIIIGLIDRDSVLGRHYEKNKASSVFYKDATFHTVDEIIHGLEQSGFHHFDFAQALLPGDSHKNTAAVVKTGYGEGSFVVLRAQKPPAE
ncbi:class I SAM-dependent methyltransferase [Sulfuriflexus mobilis]|uniref:class I SAM-dependent methyltransferase n=1 Tax=Sulfuriflexus mobilis TaxID=1811807 RepID=UPI000F844D7B|nr:class I SAM-dependent methyltransferase [Sulfuriflexus mobilis]